MSTTRLTAWLRLGALFLASAGVLALSACGGGSGAPNNPYVPPVTPPGPLTVVPDEAIAFAGTPLILSISGGTPPYFAFSGNTAALPVPQNVSGNTLALLANNVDQAQVANVTIRDSGGQTAVSEITVRPALLLPASITIVPNGVPCTSGDVCSGQTSVATVRVTGPTGAALPGRSVRFDVVQGAFSLQTTNPGSPLAPTQTVVSDVNGESRVVIAVAPNTPTQIGLLRATELSTGSQVTAQFVIAQVVSGEGVLSVLPSGATTITGPFQRICSSGVRVSHYIFGGTPPYRIVVNFPDAITLVNSVVNTNGGGFDIITNGTCFSGLTFGITDANGRTVLSPPTVNNVEGTTAQPTPTPTPTPPQALQISAAGTGTAAAPVACGPGATFALTITGVAPFSASASRPNVILNPNPIPNSPGQLNVSGAGLAGGATTITVGDSTTPQQLAAITIYCQ